MAALIGAGPVSDAFFVANKLPNLFRRLFGEGAFNAALARAGIFRPAGAPMDPEAARQFAREAISVMTFWLGAITILGEIFMPELMHQLLAPGFAEIPDKFALTVDLGTDHVSLPDVDLSGSVAVWRPERHGAHCC